MDAICPLLAVAADGRSVIDGVDPGHRCHAEPTPLALDRRQQAEVCLTPAHEACERFLQHAARTGGIRPRTAPIGDGLVSTRLLLTPEPAWRGIAGRARRAPTGRILGAAAGAVLLAGGGAAVAAVLGGGSPPAGIESPSPTTSPTSTESVRPTPTPTPVATPRATPSSLAPTPTATPVASFTPVPSPTPTPARTYVVQQGDTLSSIAAQFGTTVQAMQQANGISDPNVIVVGQVLVIP
ncbi:MAG: LysM peptidoglycan-binding domain-containing protein [Candidatus Limnocylindria bacterium]